jgi:cellulose synthase operon protein YhjQ
MGLQAPHHTGLAQLILGQATPREVIHTVEAGWQLCSFGNLTATQNHALTCHLAEHPHTIGMAAMGLSKPPNIHIIDTPRWPHPLTNAALALSDLNLVIQTPDANAALALDVILPSLRNARGASYFVMNNFDSTKVLHLDLWALSKIKLSHRLIPFYLHADQAQPESMATGVPLSNHAPHSQLLEDQCKLANWIDGEMA